METSIRSLPCDVAQHIQSLMDCRDAARMATVSKNLYAAWLRRKNIEFDESHFRQSSGICWEYARNSLKRYELYTLKIDSFTVRVNSKITRHHDTYDLLVRAARLGAEVICIEVRHKTSFFNIPEEVLASKHLKQLSLIGGNFIYDVSCQNSTYFISLLISRGTTKWLGGNMIRSLVMRSTSLKELVSDSVMLSWNLELFGNVFHGLESLTLHDVIKEGAAFFADIIRIFPSLKYLAVRRIYDCDDILICSKTLVRLSFCEFARPVFVVLNVPNLRRFRLEGPALSCIKFEVLSNKLESDLHIVCFNCNASWLSLLHRLLENFAGSKIYLVVDVKNDHSNYICDYNIIRGTLPAVERLDIKTLEPCPGVLESLFMVCRPRIFHLHKNTF